MISAVDSSFTRSEILLHNQRRKNKQSPTDKDLSRGKIEIPYDVTRIFVLTSW